MSAELLEGLAAQHDEMLNQIVETKYQVYFDRNTGIYYIPDARGRWFKGIEKLAQRHLKLKHNVSSCREKGTPHSDMEEMLWRINQKCQVGYGGKLAGPVLVEATHASSDVGDEPLLLARVARTMSITPRPSERPMRYG